jgi:hypothetical protein
MPFLEQNRATDQDLVRSMKYQAKLLAADEGMFRNGCRDPS